MAEGFLDRLLRLSRLGQRIHQHIHQPDLRAILRAQVAELIGAPLKEGAALNRGEMPPSMHEADTRNVFGVELDTAGRSSSQANEIEQLRTEMMQAQHTDFIIFYRYDAAMPLQIFFRIATGGNADSRAAASGTAMLRNLHATLTEVQENRRLYHYLKPFFRVEPIRQQAGNFLVTVPANVHESDFILLGFKPNEIQAFHPSKTTKSFLFSRQAVLRETGQASGTSRDASPSR